jgi:hypothetical protein
MDAGPASEVWYMNSQQFSLPINIVPERRGDIRELRLFVSRDEGQSWQIADTKTPDRDKFAYTAPGDGRYWFTVAIFNQRGQQEPTDVSKVPVGQKVVVDTTRPVIKFDRAEWQGDEIAVRWLIWEECPEETSLKLEYHPADNPAAPWTPVSVSPGPTGQTRFRPGSSGPISIRLSLKDKAGNEGVETKELPGLGGPAGGPGGPIPLPTGNPLPGTGGSSASTGPGSTPTGPEPWGPGGTGVTPTVGLTSGPGPGNLTMPRLGPDAVPVGTGPAPIGTGTAPGTATSPVASSTSQPPPSLANNYSATPGPASTLPPLQLVNTPQFRVEFEVTKCGPSGLGGVDVWLTADDGRTWEKSVGDHRPALPPAGTPGNALPQRGAVTITLPREGVIYGITVLVKNRAGLSKPPPRPGEPPQLRVEVDATLPEAELYAPVPDPTRKDTLLLAWKAKDRNLTATPITLEWAERKEGPWKAIGPLEHANWQSPRPEPALNNLMVTGKFSWSPPSDIPPNVFLRLTVRDGAGNKSVAESNEPVLVDLTLPEISGTTVSSGPGPTSLPPH